MKIFTKLTALVMVLAILASFTAISTSAEQPDGENLPVIFIGGKGTTLINADGETIYPRTYDIEGSAKKIVPALVKANLTNQFDEFCDVLYDTVSELFKDLPLDCNGNASNGTGTDFRWTKTTLSWSVRKDEPYRIYDYCFYYDWRLDPCETADIFNAYINDVLEVTGAEKVKIIARCMGGNIVLAYLNEYGCEKVDRCLFYVSTINGVSNCGAPFAGDFEINGDAAARFALDFGMDPIYTAGDDTINELIGSAVNMLNMVNGVDIAVDLVENVYVKVRENVVPRLLLATFATYPSYWSMIGDNYYEAAKACTFANREAEYAGLIEKTDNYHYNIQVKVDDILKKLESEGLDITVVCKYGVQSVPISKEYNLLSDDTVELADASFGATCTELDETFDCLYMKKAERKGTAKYISPDKQVDCSTCLFPDNTWVIKNCTHTDFPECINDLMMEIMRYPGRMSVYDNADYPQYLLYNKSGNTLSPLTDDNCNTTERWEQTFFESMLNVLKIIFSYIKNIIAVQQ